MNMVLEMKSGQCRICRNTRRPTEWHHIISQAHAIKTQQQYLLHDPNNVVELCKVCHNQTTASMVRKRLTRQGKRLDTPERRGMLFRQNKAKEEQEAARKAREEAILAEREAMMESITILRARFVQGKSGDVRRTLKVMSRAKRECGSTWEEIGLEQLYPPDHWKHDAEQYDKDLCLEFESTGWIWTSQGGARYRPRGSGPACGDRYKPYSATLGE